MLVVILHVHGTYPDTVKATNTIEVVDARGLALA